MQPYSIYTNYLDALNSQELKTICLHAYIGTPFICQITENAVKTLKIYPKKKLNLNYFFEDPNLIRLLDNSYFYFYNCQYATLRSEIYISALFYLLEKKPEWVMEFEELKFKRSDISILIWEICKSIHEGEPIKNTVTSSNLFSEKTIICLLHILNYNPDSFDGFIEEFKSIIKRELLFDGFLKERFSIVWQKEFLLKLLDFTLKTDELDKSTKNSICSFINFTNFICYGIDCDLKTLSSVYKNNYLAIKELYKGNYALSVQYFLDSLKENNKFNTEKNIFLSPHLNYFLVLAYIKDNSEKSQQKLTQLLRKKVVSDKALYYTAFIPACYINKAREETPLIYIKKLHACSEAYTNLNGYAYLFSKYWEMLPECTKEIDQEKDLFIPDIIKHELSPFIEIPEAEKMRLKKIYGGEPLLHSIKQKKQWEIYLEELINKLDDGRSGTEGGNAVVKSRRLCYIINYDYIEIREQSILKSGKWSNGKRISTARYESNDLDDIMDETDFKIREAFYRSNSYSININHALPYLVGSDKLYTGVFSSTLTPVKVEEEKPYIIIEQKKNGDYKVSSNVDRFIDDNYCIKKVSDTHYVVIKLEKKQQFFYNQLLKNNVFPAEASAMLTLVLEKVSEFTEVHSPLINNGETLKPTKCDPRLVLQITPSSASYNIKCCIAVMPNSKKRYTPGRGEIIVFEEISGKYMKVRRNLKAETNLLKSFEELMEENTDCSFSGNSASLDLYDFLFLLDYLKENPQTDYILEWPEGEKIRLRNQLNSSCWKVNLKSDNNWFEMEGEVMVDEDTILSISDFIDLLRKSKSNYIQLNKTDYISVSDTIRKQLMKLDSMAVKQKNKNRISTFNIGQLAEFINSLPEKNVKTDKDYDSFLNKIRKASELEAAVPKTLQAELRDYQLDGFRWMARLDAWGAGACLADDMGLGKTLQAITFMLYKADKGPSLIATPASVLYNWKREIERFAPSLKINILNETNDRLEVISSVGKGDILLSTYGLLITEEEAIVEKSWNVVCLDEAHIIKNRDTKISSVAMQLKSESRLILTGTPIQNYLGELWNLFQFINPGLLGSFEQFYQKFITPIEQDNDKNRQLQLRNIIRPFILRRTKADVLEELPDKSEILYPVMLSDEEMAAYEIMRLKAKQSIEEENKVNVNTLAEITRLRQAACSVSLVDKKWNGESSKIKAFKGLVNDIIKSGHSTLVFSQFTSFLSFASKALDEENIPYIMLNGSTTVKKRESLVNEFQSGKYSVFLISLKAGGLGLNLTEANYVIHLDPWWNPAIEQQATDRAYRIGQRNNVTVYRLISKNTIEEKILRMHEKKQDLADSLLEGADISHKLSVDDLLDMLKTNID